MSELLWESVDSLDLVPESLPSRNLQWRVQFKEEKKKKTFKEPSPKNTCEGSSERGVVPWWSPGPSLKRTGITGLSGRRTFFRSVKQNTLRQNVGSAERWTLWKQRERESERNKVTEDRRKLNLERRDVANWWMREKESRRTCREWGSSDHRPANPRLERLCPGLPHCSLQRVALGLMASGVCWSLLDPSHSKLSSSQASDPALSHVKMRSSHCQALRRLEPSAGSRRSPAETQGAQKERGPLQPNRGSSALDHVKYIFVLIPDHQAKPDPPKI